jgi:hypothetical protein
MNKAIILCLAVICFISISGTEAFCGGCGCNIFGCNCDYRECRRPKGRRSINYPTVDLLLKDMDMDHDGMISLSEATPHLKYKRLLTAEFTKLDLNHDGKLDATELDGDVIKQ